MCVRYVIKQDLRKLNKVISKKEMGREMIPQSKQTAEDGVGRSRAIK